MTKAIVALAISTGLFVVGIAAGFNEEYAKGAYYLAFALITRRTADEWHKEATK